MLASILVKVSIIFHYFLANSSQTILRIFRACFDNLYLLKFLTGNMSAYQNRAFTNTASGKLNQQQAKQHKLIDLSDVDAELLQPQLLSDKTLKKSLPPTPAHLARTNPQELQGMFAPTHDQPSYSSSF
jgi:hypothetical protein